jgi:hypothetical protein
VSDDRVTGEGSVVIVELSEQVVYIVMAVGVAVAVVVVVVLAAVVVAGVVVTAVVVTAAGVESMLIAAVQVLKDTSKSMAFLSTAAMLLIDLHGRLVLRYG